LPLKFLCRLLSPTLGDHTERFDDAGNDQSVLAVIARNRPSDIVVRTELDLRLGTLNKIRKALESVVDRKEATCGEKPIRSQSDQAPP